MSDNHSNITSDMSEDNLKQKTKVGFYWKFIEQLATNGLQFVVGIVMARLLTPEDYGITALPAVFMAIATTLIESGFGTALIRKPDLTEKDLSTAFYYSIGMGLFLYAVMFFAAPWIAFFFGHPILTPLVRITALTFLIGPLATPQTVILRRKLDFKTPARIAIITRIISAAVGIYAAYIGYGLWALVIFSLTGTILTFVLTWIVVKWMPKERFSKDSFRYLWGFGNKMMASGVLNTTYQNIAPLLVGKYFGPSELGLFNRASGYASLPYQQVSGSVQTVTFPVLSKLQDNDELLEKNYNRLIRAINFVFFPVMVLLIGLAHPLIIVMLTEKWAACVILLQIECLVTIWGPLSVLNGNILQVKGRSDLYLTVDFKKKLVGLALMAVSLPFGLVPYCCGRVVAQMYTLYANISCVAQILPMNFAKQMKQLIPTIMLSFVMLLSILLTNLLFSNSWLQLIVGAIVGIAVYSVGAFVFRFQEIEEVKYMLNSRNKKS